MSQWCVSLTLFLFLRISSHNMLMQLRAGTVLTTLVCASNVLIDSFNISVSHWLLEFGPPFIFLAPQLQEQMPQYPLSTCITKIWHNKFDRKWDATKHRLGSLLRVSFHSLQIEHCSDINWNQWASSGNSKPHTYIVKREGRVIHAFSYQSADAWKREREGAETWDNPRGVLECHSEVLFSSCPVIQITESSTYLLCKSCTVSTGEESWYFKLYLSWNFRRFWLKIEF